MLRSWFISCPSIRYRPSIVRGSLPRQKRKRVGASERGKEERRDRDEKALWEIRGLLSTP